MEKIVVIGASIAGLSAIEVIRRYDSESEIVLIGGEDFYPYNRMKLTKELDQSLAEEDMMLKKREWYLAQNVLFIKGTEVTKIDTKSKKVQLADERFFDYTKLLITTGSYSRRPVIKGIEKNRVVGLRSLKDADHIKELIGKGVKSAVIIGGGVQGIEIANSLSKQGLEVSLIELGDRLMGKALDKEASNQVVNRCEQAGIEVYLSTFITEICGKERVKQVKTNTDKKIQCQMVIYSIGVIPELEVVKGTKIKKDHGIIVNEKMETNLADVYSAGDVASYEGHMPGLWTVALEQGRVAGAQMCGQDTIYEPQIPVVQLHALEMNVISIGHIEEENVDFIFYEKDGEKSYKVYIRDHKVIGAVLIGDRSLIMPLRTAIKNKTEIQYNRDMTLKELRESLKPKKTPTT